MNAIAPVATSTHADAATAALRGAIAAPHAQLREAVAATASAVTQIRAQTDIVLLMSAVDSLSLCAEALAKAAAALHEQADAALTTAMSETGCTGFATASHTVSLVNGVPRVNIIDSAAVPSEMMTVQQPAPDKRKIAALLKSNPAVNWARLLPGRPHLQRRTRS